ncbi:MAG: class I SAM-dependent methyltransferase [Candidatus Diapherotrites archaeon]|nr:class I SAM-dependent methyltransferase [Candidatus Diapherotrites archaeon]
MSLKMLAPSYYNRFRTAVRLIGTGKNLLDIGCSDGVFEEELQEKFEKITGMDLNEQDLKKAKSRNLRNSRFIKASAYKIPFNAKFDKALSIEVIEHLEKPEKMLQQARKSLKKGGVLVISTPNRNFPFTYDPINYLLEKVFGKHIGIGIYGFGHERIFSFEELKELLEKNGFKIQEAKFLNHYFAGLCENYLSTILQPLFKSDPKNRQAKKEFIGSKEKPPKILEGIVKAILKVDELLFKNSKTSVGMMVKAARVK